MGASACLLSTPAAPRGLGLLGAVGVLGGACGGLLDATARRRPAGRRNAPWAREEVRDRGYGRQARCT